MKAFSASVVEIIGLGNKCFFCGMCNSSVYVHKVLFNCFFLQSHAMYASFRQHKIPSVVHVIYKSETLISKKD